MLERFIYWNDFLGRRMIFTVLLALFLGFNLSLPKNIFLSTFSVGLFAYMTFITALETKFRDFFQVLSKPWVPLWILFLIHAIAPLLAWAIGAFFYPQDFFIRLGLLVSASIPIAVTSIIWTSLAEGDVTLALVAVTLDTLFVPLFMPSFFAVIVGKTIHLDYIHMLFQLLGMVTIPSFLGMAINDLTDNKLHYFSRSVGGLTSKIALFLVITINAGIVAPAIHWNLSLVKLLFVILLITVLGYVLGYIGSLIIRERNINTVTAMIFNVGMRNISFGAVLAIGYFPPQVSIPVTLAMLFQQPIATLVFYLLRLSKMTGIKNSEGSL